MFALGIVFAFFGRSIACSLTSTRRTSTCKSLDLSTFYQADEILLNEWAHLLPSWSYEKLSLRKHHKNLQYEIEFDTLANTSRSSRADLLGSILEGDQNLGVLCLKQQIFLWKYSAPRPLGVWNLCPFNLLSLRISCTYYGTFSTYARGLLWESCLTPTQEAATGSSNQ